MPERKLLTAAATSVSTCLAALLLAGCATASLYGGPRRSADEVAVIKADKYHNDVRVVEIDGRRVSFLKRELAWGGYSVLPGRHVMLVELRGHNRFYSPAPVSFTAKAGHVYRVGADVARNMFKTWQASWKPFISDEQTGERVSD